MYYMYRKLNVRVTENGVLAPSLLFIFVIKVTVMIIRPVIIKDTYLSVTEILFSQDHP